MRVLYILFGLILIATVLVSGCVQPEMERLAGEGEQITGEAREGLGEAFIEGMTEQEIKDYVIGMCTQRCLEARVAGQNLSPGPCLSDEIIPDWVCDVAHSPRQDIDNLPENQCPAWQVTAHHFVEVDPGCDFIRAV